MLTSTQTKVREAMHSEWLHWLWMRADGAARTCAYWLLRREPDLALACAERFERYEWMGDVLFENQWRDFARRQQS